MASSETPEALLNLVHQRINIITILLLQSRAISCAPDRV